MPIGTCGWSYLPKKFVEPGESRLRAYAKIFNVAEINSTFYQLPKTSTARAWRKEVDSVNDKFEFTVKVPKLITHISGFSDTKTWEKICDIGEALHAKIMVFQTPTSFKDNKQNLAKVKKFFKQAKGFKFVMEPREWKLETIEKVFPEIGLIHVTDPFKDAHIKQKFNYYRMHGKGKIMYRYRFKDDDLAFLKKNMSSKDYIFFNNIFMYDDAMRMMELMK